MKKLIKKLEPLSLPVLVRSLKEYLTSPKGRWYFLVLGLTIATLLSTSAISEDAFPLSYLRYFLGFVFLCWLPGFCFAKALSLEKSFSKAVEFLLCIPLSLGLVLIIGLIVNFLPGGLRLAPVIVALSIFTVASATVALFLDQGRSHKTGSDTYPIDKKVRGGQNEFENKQE